MAATQPTSFSDSQENSVSTTSVTSENIIPATEPAVSDKKESSPSSNPQTAATMPTVAWEL